MSDFTDDLKPANPQGPDILAQERSRSDINVEALAQHLLHRGGRLERQQKILPVLQKRPVFSKKNQLNLARPDRYHLSLARSKELRRLSLEYNWDLDDYKVAIDLVGEVGPYALHTVMFMTSIREQASEEQLKEWWPRVENWKIIGCYGQTELGHGSNVRGVETLATYSPATKDFTIHSPTLTAAKWWNGSLGRTANHAIIVAQLLLPDGNGKLKSYGPHQFVAQVRDMKTNKPLEGIVIGDIGTKVGYAGMDNGYMLFKNFKIPHSALLSKYTGVSIDGKYIAPKNQAVVYGSMTYVRASIIMNSRMILARACTIAVRYLSIRRQFADRDQGGVEMAVLDYPTVQIRILPLLATTYALHYTGEAMFNLYWQTRADIEQKGDLSRLAELHAVSSGLKAACTIMVADGTEVCRRALGGHGFGGGSGMIPINTDNLDAPTVEGDSWMISQQTAAYLVKRMTEAVARKSSESIDVQFQTYLKDRSSSHYDIYNNEADIVRAFKDRVSFLVYNAYEKRVVQKQPWTDLMVDLHRLAIAHSESMLVENFYKAVFVSELNPSVDKTTATVMKDLFRLFAYTLIESKSAELIVSGALEPSALGDLTPKIQTLLRAVRPHAVRLVDAWSIPDYLLDSALGRADGDVYNALWQKAHLENPLNLTTFNPDFQTEEIILGEGAENARRRIEKLALGVWGHEQRKEGEGQHPIIPRQPYPMPANARLVELLCTIPLAAASMKLSTDISDVVFRKFAGVSVFKASFSLCTFLTTAFYVPVFVLSESRTSHFNSRVLGDQGLEMKPFNLWERSDGVTMDDGAVVGALGGLLGLGRKVPSEHFLGQKFLPFRAVKFATLGALLGSSTVCAFFFWKGTIQRAWAEEDAQIKTKEGIFRKWLEDPRYMESLDRLSGSNRTRLDAFRTKWGKYFTPFSPSDRWGDGAKNHIQSSFSTTDNLLLVRFRLSKDVDVDQKPIKQSVERELERLSRILDIKEQEFATHPGNALLKYELEIYHMVHRRLEAKQHIHAIEAVRRLQESTIKAIQTRGDVESGHVIMVAFEKVINDLEKQELNNGTQETSEIERQ
ncbi:hypothetical protein K504DRAFT_446846 [Pleomassaria siparia CBS 279.74]|uniref:acyl-CoA oxidase n=1 Tax=Pleomassaria siparia CBS 279.74 TaxID=1314801 RepID=A0A6G1K4D5_9PLEO|nr:hypothetical protein K504DRAFT_446846 [Pleomassaria siparia CBS 279.74]